MVLVFQVILSCVRVQISSYFYRAYPNPTCVSIDVNKYSYALELKILNRNGGWQRAVSG